MNPQYQTSLPQPPKKMSSRTLSPKILLVIIGVVVAILASVGFVVLSSNNSPTKQMERLSARFTSLQLIIDEGTKGVQNVDLRKVQSDASILVKGNIVTVTSAMEAAGLGKLNKDTIALESDTPTLEMLADAKLNGRFDDAYKKALSQKLESTMALMREVNNKTNNRMLKTSLTSAYNNFSSLLDQLAKL